MSDSALHPGKPTAREKIMAGNAKSLPEGKKPVSSQISFLAAAKNKRSWSYPGAMFVVGCVLVAVIDRSIIMVGMVAFACGSAYLSNILAAKSIHDQ
jgi:hypothetical protein